VESAGSDVDRIEGLGALNFLNLDDVIDNDLILVWADEKRVITGADLLGRLLRGIAVREPAALRAGLP
jgi:hypothetical protein